MHEELYIIRIWPFSAFDNEELQAIRKLQKHFLSFFFLKPFCSIFVISQSTFLCFN